jgi:hypothetical protein
MNGFLVYFIIGAVLGILSIPLGILLKRRGLIDDFDGGSALYFAGSLLMIWPLLLAMGLFVEAEILINRLAKGSGSPR